MARVLNLNPSVSGMSSIINVLQHVGAGKPNNPDDVKVVQELLKMTAKGQPVVAEIGVPGLTGRFDACTGFWIFHSQAHNKQAGHTRQIVDGIVSPARDSTYADNATWTIIQFNFLAWKSDPRGYAQFFERWAASSMAATH